MALPFGNGPVWDREEMLQMYRNEHSLDEISFQELIDPTQSTVQLASQSDDDGSQTAPRENPPGRGPDSGPGAGRPRRRTALAWRLDPIDPDIIGKVRIDRSYETSARLLGPWATVTTRFLRGDLTPQERSAEEVLRRGLPHIHDTNPFVDNFGQELINDVKLLKPVAGPVRSRCGLFGVKKSESTLRVIFDARQANTRLQPIPVRLSLFTLDELVRVWADASRDGEVFIINVDYRHYYYQIRIPPWLRPYVTVYVDGVAYSPEALPMGYRDACLMAQVVTWCIVLHREPGEDALGVPEAVLRGGSMPPFLPLEGGGAIFVLLDGVFIVDNNAVRHAAWAKRLLRNEQLFCVRRKIGNHMRFSRAGREHSNAGGESPLPEKIAEACTFAGVEFLSASQLAPAKPLVPVLGGTPSWREVAGRLGRLLWRLRVLGAGRLPTNNPFSLLNHERLLELWATVGKTAENAWSQTAVIDSGALRYLGGVEESVRAEVHDMAAVAPAMCRRCIDEAGIYVVDATRWSKAYVKYVRREDGRLWYHSESSERWSAEIEQGEAELVAALWVAEIEAARGPCKDCGQPPIALIGEDADGPRAAIRKGYSRSPPFRRLMRPVFEGGRVRVETARVPGVNNAADAPSRQELALAYPDRVRTSAALLAQVLLSWLLSRRR